jgi:hypothetical protein
LCRSRGGVRCEVGEEHAVSLHALDCSHGVDDLVEHGGSVVGISFEMRNEGVFLRLRG